MNNLSATLVALGGLDGARDLQEQALAASLRLWATTTPIPWPR
jgi:hypothetical protein